MTIRGKVATTAAAPALKQRGFDVKPLVAGGLQMGPCYYYIWQELSKFTLAPKMKYPYMQFLECPTATGEFCTGAALALGLTRTLLWGKPCTPSCTGKPCGADNGCGGTCGTCPKKDAAIPKKDAATPKKDAATPKKDATASKKDATAPKKDATAPKKDAATPKKDAAPARDARRDSLSADSPHRDGPPPPVPGEDTGCGCRLDSATSGSAGSAGFMLATLILFSLGSLPSRVDWQAGAQSMIEAAYP